MGQGSDENKGDDMEGMLRVRGPTLVCSGCWQPRHKFTGVKKDKDGNIAGVYCRKCTSKSMVAGMVKKPGVGWRDRLRDVIKAITNPDSKDVGMEMKDENKQ
jgi:hypothetical protein